MNIVIIGAGLAGANAGEELDLVGLDLHAAAAAVALLASRQLVVDVGGQELPKANVKDRICERVECVFVDDREENVAAAAARGWATHLFRGPEGLAARLVAEGLLGEAEAA